MSMFMPMKVTPIKIEKGEVVECDPITIDVGDMVDNESIEINGKYYTSISLMDVHDPDDQYSEYLIKESVSLFTGG